MAPLVCCERSEPVVAVGSFEAREANTADGGQVMRSEWRASKDVGKTKDEMMAEPGREARHLGSCVIQHILASPDCSRSCEVIT